jgi:hypothetical protein
VGLKYSANIRDFLGIWKDRAELKRIKLETREIEKKQKQENSLVHLATAKEIETYDPNTATLVQKINKANPFKDYAFLQGLIILVVILVLPKVMKVLWRVVHYFLR